MKHSVILNLIQKPRQDRPDVSLPQTQSGHFEKGMTMAQFSG